MASHNCSRSVAAIAREVADILESEVKDPGTTFVEGSPDDPRAVLSALALDGPFIRSQVARRISARRVPGLSSVLPGPVCHGVEEEGSGGT